MAIIKQLPLHEAQKIAAGEVVERPANVIKELMENSVDAGATHITIKVVQSGQQEISITDNGSGMDEQDAHLCFEHHATSKISSVDDLVTMRTFGFRGEALSSISAVSKVNLLTKTAEQSEGRYLERENNQFITDELRSCPTGTTITIRDLFFNVPARKKFLKKPETEWRHITLLFQAFCLDHLDISFKLYSDDKLIYNCPATADLKNRCAQLYDAQLADNLIDVPRSSHTGACVSGVISNHHYYRYDRNHLFFFINKRLVKNFQLAQALIKGYLNVIPANRYPAGALFLEVDPQELDINIHPKKEEVEFLHPRRVQTALTTTVKKTLEEHLSAQLKRPVTFTQEKKPHYTESPQPFSDVAPEPFTIPRFAFAQEAPVATTITNTPQSTVDVPLSTHNNDVQTTVSKQSYKLLGQLHTTYLLLEHSDGLYIVDQHAAHERIMYEKFKKRFDEIATTQLMFPQTITLSTHQLQTLLPYIPLLEQQALGIEPFNDYQVIITATPTYLQSVNLEELLKEMISWIEDYKGLAQEDVFKRLNEKLHAQMACKAAVKAGDVLSKEQMEQLLDDLQKTDSRFTCPHGRPTGWLLSQHDIEKKFKRKL